MITLKNQCDETAEICAQSMANLGSGTAQETVTLLQAAAHRGDEEEDEEEDVPVKRFGNVPVSATDNDAEISKMRERKRNLEPDQLAPAHMVQTLGGSPPHIMAIKPWCRGDADRSGGGC